MKDIVDLYSSTYLSIPEREWDFIRDHAHMIPHRHSPRSVEAKPGRNEPCMCGSGKKFKKCCIDKE